MKTESRLHSLFYAILMICLVGGAPAATADPIKSAPVNTAIVPVPKLEQDFYDWWGRHREVLKIKDSIDPEIVLLGDSITHLWGGQPVVSGRPAQGVVAFERTFQHRRVLNLGFGYDRIQNVLWRIDHDELTGIHPKYIIVNIGTNNLVTTEHARSNTPAEIVQGIETVVGRLREKSPRAKILLMGIFPRGESPQDPLRAQIAEVNSQLAKFGRENQIGYLDLGPQLVLPDGTISKKILGDFLHPTEAGYTIWGDGLRGFIK